MSVTRSKRKKSNVIDFDAVISELRQELRRIDRAIAAFEHLRPEKKKGRKTNTGSRA